VRCGTPRGRGARRTRHLYTLSVTLEDGRRTLDSYTLEVGIRTIEVRGDRLLLNGQPLLLKGFGRHEDFPINGRGLNVPLLVRDHELLRWVGANSYRTSHYPYSEEAMMLADRLGILVIDETPAVSLTWDGPEVVARRLERARGGSTELIARQEPPERHHVVRRERADGRQPDGRRGAARSRRGRHAVLPKASRPGACARRLATRHARGRHERTHRLARSFRRGEHQPLLRLVHPGRPPRRGQGRPREGARRATPEAREADRRHGFGADVAGVHASPRRCGPRNTRWSSCGATST
jgi:hypothetical protein